MYKVILRFVLLGFLGVTASSSFSQAADNTVGPSYGEVVIEPSIELYPNPAVIFVNVRLGELKAENVKLSLHNIIGNEMEADTETVDDNLVRIKVKDIAAGYYFITIKDESTRFRGTYKFLKK